MSVVSVVSWVERGRGWGCKICDGCDRSVYITWERLKGALSEALRSGYCVGMKV